MPGLLHCRPKFSPSEAAEARVQRASLAVLLVENPSLTDLDAARRLGLHEDTVRKWRVRWSACPRSQSRTSSSSLFNHRRSSHRSLLRVLALKAAVMRLSAAA